MNKLFLLDCTFIHIILCSTDLHKRVLSTCTYTFLTLTIISIEVKYFFLYRGILEPHVLINRLNGVILDHKNYFKCKTLHIPIITKAEY